MQHRRALLDTSIVIEPPSDLAELTALSVVSTITLAELAMGLHTPDPFVAAARQEIYARTITTVTALPYTATAARAYGALCAEVRRIGRNPRARRFDLLIASVAFDEGIPLLTRNPADFAGIRAVQVVAIQ